MPDLALDYDPDTGIVRSGRFVGHHVNDVVTYLETLEAAVNADPKAKEGVVGNPPPAPPKPGTPPQTPEEQLAARSATRIQGIEHLAAATLLRQEQDDEEAFAATVPDYDKFRDKITEIKKTSPPHIRVQRGYHKGAYLFLKAQDPEMQRKLLGQEEPVHTDDEGNVVEEPVHVEEPPQPVISNTPPAAPVVKAVPPRAPAAKPTPAPRNVPPAQQKTKLKATPKIERMAATFGMSTESYMKQLEERGMTQNTVDEFSTGRQAAGATRRRTVYDA
jgi:hypothetical protein